MSTSTDSHAVQQAILQAIYAVFLGGVLTAFVAVGLFTFHPQPNLYQTQIAQLDSREQSITSRCAKTNVCTFTASEQAQLDAIAEQRVQLSEKQDVAMKHWSRTSGIAMIIIATGLLALSLIRWDRAIVLSNGLLLGGLFTMVFGIGLTLAGGDDVWRFVVLGIALTITVVLGYLRFARPGGKKTSATGAQATGAASTSGVVASPEFAAAEAELEARVDALAARMEAMRRALE